MFKFIKEMQIVRTCQNKEMKLTEQKSNPWMTKYLRKSVSTMIIHQQQQDVSVNCKNILAYKWEHVNI